MATVRSAEFRYRCKTCGQHHSGVPALAANAPLYYYAIPEGQRNERCELTSETCIVDGEHFFVRGNIEIPVAGLNEPFVWGVWVSLSATNFDEFLRCSTEGGHSGTAPWFGWLSADFLVYPDSENLKTMVHPQGPGMRPLIELEPTGHPLAVEQREGIGQDRLAEILSTYLHR